MTYQLLTCHGYELEQAHFLPEDEREKGRADKRIATINLHFYQFKSLPLFFFPVPSPLPSISIITACPSIFVVSSLFPLSLPPYLSISIILLPVITTPSPSPPPPPPCRSPLALSPSLPFYALTLFPPSLLKPVKAYWAPLTIRSNSIRSLPCESFFFAIQMGLGYCSCCCNCSKFVHGKGGWRWIYVCIHSSSLSRSPPSKRQSIDSNGHICLDAWRVNRWESL